MPRLPGIDDVDRPNIQESSRPGYSAQSDAIGNGLSALGRGLQSMGTDLGRIAATARNKVETEQRQINGANADAYMIQRISERERELRDNPDKWEDWKKSNVDWMTKVTREASAYVNDKERPLWLAQRNVRNQTVIAQFEGQAREKHRDSYVSQTLKMTDENRKLLLDPNTSPERANEIIEATRKQFDEAASLGFMSKEQAQRNGEQWRKGTALEWLKLQTPEKRLEAVGAGSFRQSLKRQESGGRSGAQNDIGYVGLYQFGADRLRELGFYSGGAAGNDWSGSFNIPGMPQIKTLADFKASPEAQEKAGDAHFANIDKFIKDNGLEKYLGQEVAGAKISRESMYAVAHLGGNGGLKKFLTSNGGYNPADKNQTKLSDYAKKFSNAGSGMGSILAEPDKEVVRQGAYSEIQRNQDTEVATVKSNITSDITGIETTGKGLGEGDLNFERIQRALGSEAATQWQMSRGRAAKMYEFNNGLESASDAEIQKRLERLRPQAEMPVGDGPISSQQDAQNASGNVKPGYAEDLKAYQAAQKRAQDVMRERMADPAQAAEKHAEVQRARSAITKDDIVEGPDGQRGLTPKAIQSIIAARMAAQADLGIPEAERMALARRDTLNIAKQLRAVGENERGMMDLMARLRSVYGEWTDEVLAAALHFNNMDRETSKVVGEYITRFASGQPVGTIQHDNLRAAEEMMRLQKAMQPAPDNTPVNPRRGVTLKQRRPMPDKTTPGENVAPEKPNADPAKPPEETNIDINPDDLELFLKKNTPDIERRFRAKYGNKTAEEVRKRYAESIAQQRNTK